MNILVSKEFMNIWHASSTIAAGIGRRCCVPRRIHAMERGVADWARYIVRTARSMAQGEWVPAQLSQGRRSIVWERCCFGQIGRLAGVGKILWRTIVILLFCSDRMLLYDMKFVLLRVGMGKIPLSQTCGGYKCRSNDMPWWISTC